MAIQDKFNKANHIYKITKDINLNGEILTIPTGCTLDFQGGTFNNGTLVLKEQTIVNLQGRTLSNCKIQIRGTRISIQNGRLWLSEGTAIDINGEEGGENYFGICQDIRISNVDIECKYSDLVEATGNGPKGLYINSAWIIYLQNCSIKHFDIAVDINNGNDVKFTNCSIRHNNLNIRHIKGGNNAFINGDIEAAYRHLDLYDGIFTIETTYIEAHNASKGYRIYGGTLNINNSFINAVFFNILGNCRFSLINNNIRTTQTNVNWCSIEMNDDYDKAYIDIIDNNLLDDNIYLFPLSNNKRFQYFDNNRLKHEITNYKNFNFRGYNTIYGNNLVYLNYIYGEIIPHTKYDLGLYNGIKIINNVDDTQNISKGFICVSNASSNKTNICYKNVNGDITSLDIQRGHFMDKIYIPQANGFYNDTDANKLLWYNGSNYYCIQSIIANNTTKRPTNLTENYKGFCYFDTTLNKPIWWTGTKWVDATGSDV